MDQGDTESALSDERTGTSHPSHHPQTPDLQLRSPELHRQHTGLDSVMPGDSASAHGGDRDRDLSHDDEVSALVGAQEETPFTFKFKSPGGRVHRIAVTASAGLEDLVTVVAEKLGSETTVLGGVPTFDEGGKMSYTGFALSYLDNDGDTVSLTTDHDLLEAITLARRGGKEKVDLFVHDPEKAVLPPTTEAPVRSTAIPPTPPESHVQSRKQYLDDEDADADAEVVGAGSLARGKGLNPSAAGAKPSGAKEKGKEQAQILSGVPNEMLVPGALIVLGAALVITFAIGRSSSR